MTAPVIAVVGPSGVGKDTVMAALATAVPGFEMAQRVITRPAGAGGEEFRSVSGDEFQRMQDRGAFALSWQAHGLRYGIPARIDAQRLSAGAVLVNLSRSVLVAAQTRFGDLIVLALSASPEVLADRLRERGRESATDQAGRLGRAEMALPDGLSRVIRVDNSAALEMTVQSVLEALGAERGKRWIR